MRESRERESLVGSEKPARESYLKQPACLKDGCIEGSPMALLPSQATNCQSDQITLQLKPLYSNLIEATNLLNWKFVTQTANDQADV